MQSAKESMEAMLGKIKAEHTKIKEMHQRFAKKRTRLDEDGHAGIAVPSDVPGNGILSTGSQPEARKSHIDIAVVELLQEANDSASRNK